MTGEPTWRRRTVAWLAARSVRQLLLAVGAVILLASGAFGGLRQADLDGRDVLELDVPHVSEPVSITVKGVHWSDDLGEAIGPSEVGRYLLVIADLTSTQDTSVDSFVVRESLRLEGLERLSSSYQDRDLVDSEDADPQVIVTDDRVRLGELGPGLTYEVAFIWEQEAAEPVPTTVSVLTRAHGFRQSNVDGQSNWFDVADDASGRFRVTELGAS